MEGDVAFDFLHDLVNVAVENGHRSEALHQGERARAILRAPAPFGINRPERNVGEDDNRRRGAEASNVALEPLQLLGTKVSQAAGLEIDDVDQTDEVHPALVETVPAGTARSLAVTVEIRLSLLVIEEIVLAGDIEDRQARVFDQLVGVVEFLLFGEMADVAGVNHEGWLLRQRLDLRDRLAQRRQCVRIGRLVEADMAVAYLQKREWIQGLFGSMRLI